MKEKQKTFELEPVQQLLPADAQQRVMDQDRKSTRLNSSHSH